MLVRTCLICGHRTSKGRCPECGVPTEVVLPDHLKPEADRDEDIPVKT